MEIMNNDETPRSIRFPMSLWDAIDRDAIRCKRSAVKQMQAVLLTYYELEDVEIHNNAIELTRLEFDPNPRKLDSTKKSKIPLMKDKIKKTG